MAKGKKTGGKRKGSKNKATKEREAGLAQIVAEAKTAGVTPLDVMLENMRFAHHKADELIAKVAEASSLTVEGLKAALNMRQLAEDCAKDAAPYVHPRLASVQHGGEGGGPIKHRHRIEVVYVDPADPEAIPPEGVS